MIKMIDGLLEFDVEAMKNQEITNRDSIDESHYNELYKSCVMEINAAVVNSVDKIKENLIQIREFMTHSKQLLAGREDETQKFKLYSLTVNPSIEIIDASKFSDIVSKLKKREDTPDVYEISKEIGAIPETFTNTDTYAKSLLGLPVETNLTTCVSRELINTISNKISRIFDNIENIGEMLIGQLSECNTEYLFNIITKLAYMLIAVEMSKVYAYMRAFLQIFQSFNMMTSNIITEAADTSKENVSKYIDELREMIPKCREFFDKFKYKELLTPRKKTINKMNEYMKGALERKYTLKIPLYKVVNASPDVKEIIENKFIKGLDRIVDKYPNYILMTPDFNDDDDMFIYITLKEPFGDKGDRSDRVRQSKEDGAVINEAVSTTNWEDPEYKRINDAIDAKTRIIDSTSAAIDKFIVKNGKESPKIQERYNQLCDERMKLVEERHHIAKKMMNESVTCCVCEAPLTSDERKELPDDIFGLPGRRYPLNDITHIRLAISRMDPCTVNDKSELARNIAKQVCKQKLVGKVTVNKSNSNAKYFPEWMFGDASLDGGYIHYGEKKFKVKDILNESITGSTLNFYI